MKTIKHFPLIAILFLISINLPAENINVKIAGQVGKNYYWENAAASKNLQYDQINLELFTARKINNNIVYYIFNIADNNGFIIVSADDRVLPVIGYNTEGAFTGQGVPGGLKGLLSAHAQTISEVIVQNIISPPEISAEWKKYKTPNPNPEDPKGLGPLLATTWDQGCSYNDSCPSYIPYYHGCDNAWAGCGAAAMAQILRYYSYPTSGIGSHSYQDEFPNGSGNYVTAKAHFGSTTYNYSQMSNYFYWPSTDANVAQLMYHCAVAVNMDFDTIESISYMNNILAGFKTYFGYPGGMHWEFMTDSTSWKTKIKNEMGQSPNRPLYYWGRDINDNAHFWVCDGYNNSDMFHMNWAVFNYWPNPNWPQPISYNGYYYISNLAPYPGAPDFSYRQGAIFGMTSYCTASSSSSDSSLITSFQLNTINNVQSGAMPWSSFSDYKSNFSTNLSRGGIYGVRVKVRYTFGTQPTLGACFVDWNQDGDFLDSGESFGLNLSYDYTQFVPGPPRYYGVYEGKIYVPANALIGSTPLRVRITPNSYAMNPPCGQSPHGEVEEYLVTVVSGNQAPQPSMPFVFSLDIGSDTELSDLQADGDEIFDPGDCYYYDGTILPAGGMDGFINDQPLVRGNDPLPIPGTPGAFVPIGGGFLADASVFDLDGVDVLLTDISQFGGIYPIPEFADSLISFPDHVIISYDDDTAPNWSDTQGSVPVNTSSPVTNNIFGKTSNKDEILEADFSASGATNFPLSVNNSGTVSDEASLHPQLAPNPDNGNADDDDVDALDRKYQIQTGFGIIYFTVDHEGVYIDPVNGGRMMPSAIYKYFGSPGGGVYHFSIAVHPPEMGILPDTDVDAFEFVWLWNDQLQSNALAILFSVDDDDPLTSGVDESGGMDPKQLYYSFMNGFNYPFTDEPFEEDIDAITTSGSSYLAQAIPPTWQYTPTGTSHLISLPLACNPQLNGNSIAPGDLIGVFFDSESKGVACGGYVVWDDTGNNALMAFGDDPYTPDVKEGFDEGEEFTWKVYSYNSKSDFDAEIDFDPLWPENDGKFYDNGMSALTSFTGYTLQHVTKFSGWSGISGYIEPLDPDLDIMLAPISNEFVILRNFEEVYWPEGGLSSLSYWDARQGYVMKLSEDATIDIKGVPLEDRTFLLAQGWNLLPVLTPNNVLTSSVLGIPQVVVAKEVAGSQVYWPEQGVTTLFTLNAGNAYYVYADAAAVIDFSSKAATISKYAEVETTDLPPDSWNAIAETPNSHLLAVSIDATENFNYGDIIGAFNSRGRCCGFTTIDSEKTVMAIYGDDITTPEIEGMLENEEICYKIHSFDPDEDNAVSPAFDPDFPNSGVTFTSNGLSGMTLKTSVKKPNGGFINLQIQPNPANENVLISMENIRDEVIELTLMDIIGQIVLKEKYCCKASCKMNVSQLSEGAYILTISSSDMSVTKKLVIHR